MMKMRTYTGKYVSPFDLKPKQVDIRDIAHALSLQARFNGHSKNLLSVAFHSIIVASRVPKEFQLQALLHDAAETYIGDLITPIKHHPTMSLFRDLEDKVESVIFEKFGVVATDRSFKAIKKIDTKVRIEEKKRYLVGNDSSPCSVHWIEKEFLASFNLYGGKA